MGKLAFYSFLFSLNTQLGTILTNTPPIFNFLILIPFISVFSINNLFFVSAKQN